MQDFILSGNLSNPFHCSVSSVIVEQGQIIYIRKADGTCTLPRETIYINESLIGGLMRGALEELGKDIEVIRFLGSLQTKFKRMGETIEIEKTTLYFEARTLSEGKRQLEEDEIGDQIMLTSIMNLVTIFKDEGNPEYKILERIIQSV